MMKMKQQGLVADLMPNIRVMKFFGHFVFNYYNDNSSKYLHKVYCCVSSRTTIVFLKAVFASRVSQGGSYRRLVL